MLNKNTKDIVDAFNFIKEEEAEMLVKHSKTLPKGSICVNIGAGVGSSAIAVLEESPYLIDYFYTVDIRNNDNPFGGLLNERNAFEKYKMKLPHQIHGDSKEIAKTWFRGRVNFLIIDGDHSDAGARGDIELWEKNLNKDAIVFVHDYESPFWKDVKLVVDELMFENDNYKFLEKAGTFVVFRYSPKGK